MTIKRMKVDFMVCFRRDYQDRCPFLEGDRVMLAFFCVLPLILLEFVGDRVHCDRLFVVRDWLFVVRDWLFVSRDRVVR